MSGSAGVSDVPPRASDVRTEAGELPQLFHRLNNQLGIILANAELLEARLQDDTHRARASQVVTSALDAIGTAQHIRRAAERSSVL